jgi:hypothetical protein
MLAMSIAWLLNALLYLHGFVPPVAYTLSSMVIVRTVIIDSKLVIVSLLIIEDKSL